MTSYTFQHTLAFIILFETHSNPLRSLLKVRNVYVSEGTLWVFS